METNLPGGASMSPAKTVLMGHALINGPVIVLVALGALLAPSISIRPGIGALVGAVLGWGWWSIMVPKWRRWALAQGTDPNELQRLAERTFLVWKKGSALEKTEFRGKADERVRAAASLAVLSYGSHFLPPNKALLQSPQTLVEARMCFAMRANHDMRRSRTPGR